MYRYWTTLLILIFVISCTQKEEGKLLQQDSAEYKFAKSMSQKLPILDPDLNKVLVETNRFNITTGSVFDALFKNFSSELDKLSEVDTTRIKKIFNENASLLAEKKMIITSAYDEGFDVTESEMDSIMQIQFDKVGGKEKFDNYIKSKNIPLDYIYDDYKNSLLIQKFLKSMVKDSVTINEDEIKEKMLQIRSVTVRHILLTTTNLNEKAKSDKRKKIEKILKRIKQGENFSQLAKEYSEDAGTAKNGGLIKNIKPGDMVQPFDNIAFSLGIGEISDIFETQFGFHILTVIDRKKEDRTADEIRKELIEIKQKKLMPSLIRSLKDDFQFKEFKI